MVQHQKIVNGSEQGTSSEGDRKNPDDKGEDQHHLNHSWHYCTECMKNGNKNIEMTCETPTDECLNLRNGYLKQRDPMLAPMSSLERMRMSRDERLSLGGQPDTVMGNWMNSEYVWRCASKHLYLHPDHV